MQTIKRSFSEKLNTLIKVFNIPIEERWMKYLGDDHFNYFLYLNGLEVIDKSKFTEGKIETYRVEKNKFMNVFFKKNEYYFETKNLHDKIVVDVGCGWGFLTLWYALSGVKMVYGIGFPYQIEFIDRLILRAREKKIIGNDVNFIGIAKPLEKNNSTIGDLGPEVADYIYYNDVFEHLPDDIFSTAILASYNTLIKGGKLISVTHNTDNSQILDRVQRWWAKVEQDSFMSYRRKIIRDKVPSISNEDLELMVNGTRGLLTLEFNEAIEKYMTTKKIIESQKLMPAVDLTIDYICENYISPPEVIKSMKKAGFKSSCYAGLMHSRRFVLFQPFAKIFKSVFMNLDMFSQNVVFVGVK